VRAAQVPDKTPICGRISQSHWRSPVDLADSHLVMLYDCTRVRDRDLGIAAAIKAIGQGDLIVLPTDTVYGIGADAFTAWSVTAMLNAKGRGRQMPSPVLIGSRRTLDGLVNYVPQAARDLAAAFWPGPLTIVVTHAPTLQWDLGETNGTAAVRMPLHPVALEVLAETGPMAVSSANRTGQPPATTAVQARDQFAYDVSVYLEAGPSPSTEPSTIVDVSTGEPRILRLGALSYHRLREVVPELADPRAEVHQ